MVGPLGPISGDSLGNKFAEGCDRLWAKSEGEVRPACHTPCSVFDQHGGPPALPHRTWRFS